MTEKASNHGATILIAEDVPDLRNLLQNLLHSAGYQLLIAPDGKKALEIAKALKTKRPESRIILTSAYSQGMLVMDSDWVFIPKPYFPQRLLEEVGKAISIP